jgi:hypothetical protein
VRAHDTCRELVTAFDPTFALSTSTAITASTNTQEPLLLSDNHYKYCGRRAAMNMRPQGISELVLRMYGRKSHPSMPPQWHRKGVACGTILEALRRAVPMIWRNMSKTQNGCPFLDNFLGPVRSAMLPGDRAALRAANWKKEMG